MECKPKCSNENDDQQRQFVHDEKFVCVSGFADFLQISKKLSVCKTLLFFTLVVLIRINCD